MLLLALFHSFWLSLFGNSDTTQHVLVRQVTFTGNFHTRDHILRREMDVQTGDVITVQKLDSLLEYDRRKILNTNLFLTVELKKKRIDNDTTALNFYTADGKLIASPQAIELEVFVKEQWYLLAFPVFELADRNFNEWWYERGRDLSRTIYGAYILHQNLTGNNDRLRLRAEFGFIPRLDLYYSRPYLGKKQKLGMTIGMIRLTNRTLAYRTRADKLVFFPNENRIRERLNPYVTFTYRPKFYGFHSITAQFSHTTLSDTIAKLNPNYFLNGRHQQNYVQLSYSHSLDRRDRGQYPLRGYYYGLTISRLGVFSSDDIHQWEATAGYGQYLPLGKKLFFSFSTKAKTSTPAIQPFLQTRGLGYLTDLVRGYELYVIDGQHFGLVKTNLRYQLLSRTFNLSKLIKVRQFNTFPLAIYPTIYADFGYVRNQYLDLNNSNLANRPLMGMGLGLDIVTWYNFVGHLNYSVNHLGEARFYFSFGREF